MLARNTIRIRNGVQYSVRNGFSVFARGRLIAANGMGTTLNVRLSLHPFVRIWWTILISGFAVTFVLSCLQVVGFVEIDRNGL